jgi:hypothetical protein
LLALGTIYILALLQKVICLPCYVKPLNLNSTLSNLATRAFFILILEICICFLFNYSVSRTAATSATKILPFDFRLAFVKVPNLLKKHVQLVSLKNLGPWEIYGRLSRAVIFFCC